MTEQGGVKERRVNGGALSSGGLHRVVGAFAARLAADVTAGLIAGRLVEGENSGEHHGHAGSDLVDHLRVLVVGHLGVPIRRVGHFGNLMVLPEMTDGVAKHNGGGRK